MNILSILKFAVLGRGLQFFFSREPMGSTRIHFSSKLQNSIEIVVEYNLYRMKFVYRNFSFLRLIFQLPNKRISSSN